MDYMYPSMALAYGFFAVSVLLTLFFFIRSFKDGYWGRDAEDVKYQVFQDDAVYGDLNHSAAKGPRHE
ncbi:MAG: hypothetical protein ABL995_13710 [Bryobacteraceae bacterium]